ncbi:MAG: hypothetical protein J6P97_03885 [Bacteroidales bacterium]|nr:hypothetical protein [Bacteroidales bacterium]
MKKNILTILIFGTLSLNIFAQTQNEKEYNESVIMRSSFSPVVSEAYKLSDKPTIFDSEFKLPPFRYDKTGKRFATTMTFDNIKPAKVKGEPIAKLYNTHLTAAFGTYFSSFIDASYSQTRSKDFIYAANFRHKSSLGQIENLANSSFANNNLNLYAKKIWSKFAVDANLFYDHQRHYYYGFADSLNKEKQDYRTPYHTVGTQINYQSLYREANKFHNNASFAVKHTSGKWGYKETVLNLNGGVHKPVKLFGNSQQTLGLNVSYKHILGKYSSEDITPFFNPDLTLEDYNNTQGFVDIDAYFAFPIQQFSLVASASFVPTFGSQKGFHFLPTIIVSTPEIVENIIVQGGLKSNCDIPTLHSLIQENPYISPTLHTKPQNSINIFAQADYANSNNINIKLEAGYETINNKYFYTLDQNAVLNNMFSLVYDNAKRFYIDFRFDYKLNNLILKANALYQNVKTDELEAAWYTPEFKFDLVAEYTAADKLSISLTPTFIGAMKCLNENAEIVKLKPGIDISLNIAYNYSEQLSFYVDLNNLAFQRYYEYYNYPSQRFVGLLGARFAF